jgi:hypothetical protein
MNDNCWDIEGYLLGDPSVDHQAIEQRMLDDPDFALRVAEAMVQLELIAEAAARSGPGLAAGVVEPSIPLRTSAAGAWVTWNQLLMVAAVLVVGIASALALRGPQRGFDEVATSWLAYWQGEQFSGSTLTEIQNQDLSLVIELDVAPEDAADEQWLIDGAIAFYSEQDR